MPGHVKLGAQKGEDPDPEPYLCVSMEMKRENMQKPYDSKKSYWCPDGKGGYVECMVQKKDDKEAEVLIGHIVSREIQFEMICIYRVIPRAKLIYPFLTYFMLSYFRKKCLRQKKLGKSIRQSLRCAKTWLT